MVIMHIIKLQFRHVAYRISPIVHNNAFDETAAFA